MIQQNTHALQCLHPPTAPAKLWGLVCLQRCVYEDTDLDAVFTVPWAWDYFSVISDLWSDRTCHVMNQLKVQTRQGRLHRRDVSQTNLFQELKKKVHKHYSEGCESVLTQRCSECIDVGKCSVGKVQNKTMLAERRETELTDCRAKWRSWFRCGSSSRHPSAALTASYTGTGNTGKTHTRVVTIDLHFRYPFKM